MSQILLGLAGLDKISIALICDHLQTVHGFAVVRIGARFEEALAALVGVSAAYVRDPANARRPLLDTLPPAHPGSDPATISSALRDMRCEFAHMQDREFIPSLLEQQLQDLCEQHSTLPGILIPDLLFSNEGDFIRAHSGTVLHIKNPTADAGASWTHYGSIPVIAHARDCTLSSHGTALDLLIGVDALIERLQRDSGITHPQDATA